MISFAGSMESRGQKLSSGYEFGSMATRGYPGHTSTMLVVASSQHGQLRGVDGSPRTGVFVFRSGRGTAPGSATSGARRCEGGVRRRGERLLAYKMM